MSQTTISRSIEASVAEVFDTVAHIENFSKAVPHITNVEFLSDERRGVGTRFRETRVMRGREANTELEVTEYVENERIRLVADEGGSIWDTTFTVVASGTGSELTLVMDARPHTVMARIMNPITKGIIRKSIEGDMDAVRTFCEADS